MLLEHVLIVVTIPTHGPSRILTTARPTPNPTARPYGFCAVGELQQRQAMNIDMFVCLRLSVDLAKENLTILGAFFPIKVHMEGSYSVS